MGGVSCGHPPSGPGGQGATRRTDSVAPRSYGSGFWEGTPPHLRAPTYPCLQAQHYIVCVLGDVLKAKSR